MADQADTQPLDMRSVLTDAPVDLPVNRDEPKEYHVPEALGTKPDAPWLKHLGWDIDGDGDIEGVEKNVPEPAVLRGAVVAVLGLVGAITGKVLHVDWIDEAIAAYAVCAPVVLGFWIRQHVTPAPK